MLGESTSERPQHAICNFYGAVSRLTEPCLFPVMEFNGEENHGGVGGGGSPTSWTMCSEDVEIWSSEVGRFTEATYRLRRQPGLLRAAWDPSAQIYHTRAEHTHTHTQEVLPQTVHTRHQLDITCLMVADLSAHPLPIWQVCFPQEL